ncbi:MAG: hypothetical protein LBU34_16275 [Planctomycetaceae bacterium]|nr:hypothetical protein [Planctomycetaceae bacterium]
MKKLLTLAIVFSLTLILNGVSFAQQTAAPENGVVATVTDENAGVTEGAAVTGGGEAVIVENGEVVQGGCIPVPCRPCPLRPFVRRACTPCVAAPCNPCPPCAPQPPVCAPVPRKLCNAPVLPQPCRVELTNDSYADPCGYGYAGYRPSLIRNLFARLFSRFQGCANPYYGYEYGCPEFGYGTESSTPCESH